MKLNERHSIDLTLTALAHPVRRAMIERVTRKELRVTELAEPFDMSLNAVSKHIRMLERAGLVSRRRVWREHLLSFNAEPLEQVSAWTEKTRRFWSARLDALDELLKSEDAARTRKANKKGRLR
jgi:DNA-binding transcriptional ArsR family regulator